jgi:hypothetical protein
VVRVSEAEIVPDPERDAALAYGRELEIAALEKNGALAVLRDALAESQAAMEAQVGANVMRSNREVSQRQLDYTRGYFDGARFWLEGRIALAKERVASAERAGDDPRPVGRIDPRTGEPTEGDGRT